MKRVRIFEDFINEAKGPADLHKIYLAFDPGLGHRFWSYKDFAGDKFFIRLTPENYKDIKINPEYSVLTYNSDTVQMLIDKDLIKADNVYNLPKFIKNSGSKKEFHKIVDGDENIPKTTDNKDKAIEVLGFPIIAKPAEGHSGIGIIIMKDQKQWDAADHSKLDVYSQYVDKNLNIDSLHLRASLSFGKRDSLQMISLKMEVVIQMKRWALIILRGIRKRHHKNIET